MDLSPLPSVLGTGLSADKVNAAHRAGLTNNTGPTVSRSMWAIVKANVFTRFNGLLGGLWIIVILTGSYIDGLFGLALIFNSLLGIGQEWHAKRKLDSLAVLQAPTAEVLRDGAVTTIPANDVVAGETIFLRPGDQIQADGPVLVSENLEIDESNLTGESVAIAKAPADMVFSGTAVVAGSGWFRADIVGGQATAQKLAAEARVFTRAESEVQRSTNQLLRWLTWVVIIMFPITLIAQIRGNDGGNWDAIIDNWRPIVLRSTGGLVGLVPEGLVLLTTLAFLLAAVQLTRHQALVQELPAVEGLARVDVVCLDKTGTLTSGEIAFSKITDLGTLPEGDVHNALSALVHDPQANATAMAIASAIPDAGLRVTARVPFSSARKWSGAEVEGDGSWILGAPEVVLDAGEHEDLLEQTAQLARQGIRVVVVGKVDHLPQQGEQLSTPVPGCLVELTETVRDDAAETLAYFASQGVAVKVISGDNPDTVAQVAQRVGLTVTRAVDARDLPEDPEALAQLIDTITVFGRVTPEKKRTIVRALQLQGHVVAMTGDGVNDVLALKDADIGIAMGNGTQATKAVAQIVLLDSKFSHLPKIVAEGRRLIGNVERVASLFVTKNVMSASLMIGVAILGTYFPFLPRHMSIFSTLTIGIPAFIFALGPNTRRYTPGFLKRVLMLSIPAGVAVGAASFVAVMITKGNQAASSTLALAVAFIVMFWLVGALARPYTWWKVATMAAVIAAAVGAFAIPAARTFLALRVGGTWWAAVILSAVGAAAVEIAYRYSHRAEHRATLTASTR